MVRPSPPPERRPGAGARGTGARTVAATVGVALIPLLVYAPAVLHRYGFRDDYPILREAVNEPGKVARVIGSQGRMLYGWLLESAARAAGDIDGLRWLRLGGAVGLALLAIALLHLLRRVGWSLPRAAFLAGWLVLLPSAQVLASWAICGPQVLALILAVVSFALAEAAFRPAAGPDGWPGAVGGAALTVLAVLALGAATLTYQSHALFYVVPLAAALTASPPGAGRDLRWAIKHLVVLAAGLGTAFVAMRLSFAAGLFPRSARIRFEPNLLVKLRWLVTEVLPDAMAQGVLDGYPGSPGAAYRVAVVVAGLVVLGGIVVEARRSGRRGALRWLTALAGLSAIAYSISYVASETAPTYRALYALAGVWSVFLLASLERLWGFVPVARWAGQVLLVAALTAAALLAWSHTFELFAIPQARELAVLETASGEIAARAGVTRVFVVTASQSDAPAPHRYRDEFGSVSLDAGWLAEGVFHLLMKERLAAGGPIDVRYQLASGALPPAPGSHDLVVDLRRIRERK